MTCARSHHSPTDLLWNEVDVCLFVLQHTLKIITMDDPPFRHQTNTLYTPMTTLKYADPNGDLPIDTFYKMVFEHDKVFNASLNFLKLLRWRSRKSFTLDKDKST